MSSLNDYAEAKVLDHLFGKTPFTAPNSYFVGLATGVSESGTVTGEHTIGSDGYARVEVVNNTTNWPNASGANPTIKSNGLAITFPVASGDWGELTHFFLSDAATGGNIIAWGTLTVMKHPTSGDTISFAIGDLDITLD
jgi:hypothetical protein